MANPEHIAILLYNVEVWNQWRQRNPSIVPMLNGADLSRAVLNEANLSGANLDGARLMNSTFVGGWFSGASLVKANLGAADLNFANLTNANLKNAQLDFTTFYAANLSGANLSEADLTGADFSRANLRGTNLREAGIGSTRFNDVDLSGVQGLEAVEHMGPSSIGIDTLFLSRGRIPEEFLRDCGVPEEFIIYARSLVLNPIQYNSCFISYSHKDEDFARRCYLGLRDNKLRAWYAPEDMKRGQKMHEQIDAAIQVHDRLLLILSQDSMRSEWVKSEIYKAHKRESKQKRRILFPVALVPFEEIEEWEFFDADTGKDLAREIREYYIPDFTQWKDHDVFEREFAKLLSALRANSTNSQSHKAQ